MAFIDDREWVISHIRHCFTTSDESGFCEQVIGKDEEWDRLLNDNGGRRITNHLPSYAYGQSENVDGSPTGSPLRTSSISSSSSIRSTSSEDGLLPNSFDIHFDSLRSGPPPAPQPLLPSPPPKVKTIPWRPPKDFDPETTGDLFDKKTIEPRPKEDGQVSSLSKLMSAAENMPADPFFEFVQFDGASNPGAPVKTIKVYLVMSQGEERWTPMPVVVILKTSVGDMKDVKDVKDRDVKDRDVKVSEFIGLICHHYVQSGRQPPLKNSTAAGYSLFMADDDGMVEEDFPPLDPGEPIFKYDLNLALVEKDLPPEEEVPPTIITVSIPQKGWGKIQVENESLLMKDILQIILAKRRIIERRGIAYILEKQTEPGKAIDLERPLKEMGTLEFCLIRCNSSGRDDQEDEVKDDQVTLPFLMPTLPGDDRRYKVNIVKKLRNAEVHLDINAERLEVTPLVPGAVKDLFLVMECIVDAEIIAEKAKGTATFRIRYKTGGGGEVKQVDFKCVSMVAKEIVERIGEILLRFPANRNSPFIRSDRKKPS